MFPFVVALDIESVLLFWRNVYEKLLKSFRKISFPQTHQIIHSELHPGLFSPDQIVPGVPVNPNMPVLMFLSGSVSVFICLS